MERNHRERERWNNETHFTDNNDGERKTTILKHIVDFIDQKWLQFTQLCLNWGQSRFRSYFRLFFMLPYGNLIIFCSSFELKFHIAQAVHIHTIENTVFTSTHWPIFHFYFLLHDFVFWLRSCVFLSCMLIIVSIFSVQMFWIHLCI